MAVKREVKVGLFVFLGMIVTAAVVFFIGDERRLFEPKYQFRSTFNDVQGLKPGAPVRLSGVDIGYVQAVGHGPDASDDRLYVTYEVVRGEAARIRSDSVAKVGNKGLLGDKMLEVTPGTPGHAPLPPGSIVPSEEAADYSALLGKVGDMSRKADAILTNLEKATGAFADDRAREDMRGSLHAMNVILSDVATGQGYLGRLLRDPAEAERISHAVASFDKTAQKVNETIDNVNQVVARVEKGPGFAHDIVYGTQGTDTINRFGDLAGEAALALKGVRESKSVAHGVLYGDPDQQQLVSNLGAMSADMRSIVADVRAGKGTLGGLLVDPSIYEDMKAVLGNVQRNDVLRALVRYSIKQDEKKPAVRVGEDPAGRATPPLTPAPANAPPAPAPTLPSPAR
ncbi:MAG TPA: MlaD family protein [Polyangiaceae bacterium]|nr:MlaD family protein [Polyangiaceae bacterium]